MATEHCRRIVFWWDGEYEGECELPLDHDGPHYDGLSWFDDDGSQVDEPKITHNYLSTACLHGLHDRCGEKQAERGEDGPPHCKFCDAPCRCECHGD